MCVGCGGGEYFGGGGSGGMLFNGSAVFLKSVLVGPNMRIYTKKQATATIFGPGP